MGALQPLHLMLVALAVLLVFGPRKLPELARGVGESMKELKHGLHGVASPEAVGLVPEAGPHGPESPAAAPPRKPPAGSGSAADPAPVA